MTQIPAAPPDQYLEVGGIHIRHWVVGEGPPVVLVHGLGGVAENWLLNLAALAADWRVHVLDLPGFGRSGKPSLAYSIPCFAAFLADYLEAHNLGRTCLIGNSLGGAIALQLALEHPERVSALVLADSAGFSRHVPSALRLAMLPGIGEVLVRPSPLLANWILRRCYCDASLITEEMTRILGAVLDEPGLTSSLLHILRQLLRHQSAQSVEVFLAGLRTLAVPSLVIWGREDRVLPVGDAYTAAAVLPDVELEIFERCGHLPQMECAELFNQRVIDFLKRRAQL